MNPLTERQIRASFCNASKREVSQASVPDMDAIDWERLDYLGWRDAKREHAAYVVAQVGDEPVGIMLRAGTSSKQSRKVMCAWCQDVVVMDDVSMYVARRAGAAGRRGNTIGTLICTDFSCSQNVRRPPVLSEVGSDSAEDRERIVQRRIATLRERAARFAEMVLEQGEPAADTE